MMSKKIKNLTTEYQYLRQHKAYLYAKDVTEGRIVAGKYIKKECEHFLEMIENPDS